MPIDEPRIDHPRTPPPPRVEFLPRFQTCFFVAEESDSGRVTRPLKGTRPFSFISFPVIRRVTR